MPKPRPILFVAVALALATLVAACKGAPPEVNTPSNLARGARPPRDPVEAHLVVALGERALGPAFSARPEGGLAAWVTGAEGSGRRLASLALDATGEPTGTARSVALLPVDTLQLVAGPSGAPKAGHGVAWVTLVDRGHAVWALAMGPDGAPRGKAHELSRTDNAIVWTSVVPTAAGTAVLWVEETRDRRGALVGALVDTEGTLRGVPARLATGLAAWDVAPDGDGLVVATVTDAGVALRRFGPALDERDGGQAGTPIAGRVDVDGDVRVAVDRADGVAYYVAYTERRGALGVTLARVVAGASSLEVVGPRRVVEARGGARLVALASAGARAAVAWEPPRSGRRGLAPEPLRLDVFDAGLDRAAQGLVRDIAGDLAPELVAAGSGFALLAGERDCVGARPEGCERTVVMPVLVRTNEALDVTQREVLRGGSDVPATAWGLACTASRCGAYTATGDLPSRVRAVRVAARTNAPSVARAVTPTRRAPFPLAPEGEVPVGSSVVDLAAVEVAGGVRVVVLANESRRSSSASVLLHALAGKGAPTSVSTRAYPAGGVDVAALDDAGNLAVAWVGRDGGELQVHVSRVDAKSQRAADRAITATKGDKADVALVRVPGGLVVAWVDFRGGTGSDVYAQRLGPDLAKIGGEVRVTEAVGDASDLALVLAGDTVFAAFSDTREAAADGWGDVYVARLAAKDAKKLGPEVRVLASAAHSRTPRLVPREGGGVRVAWIEELPLGSDAPGSGVQGALVAELGPAGAIIRAAERLPLGGDGVATGVLPLGDDPDGQRFVVVRGAREALVLDGVTRGPASAPAVAGQALVLDGPPSLDAAIVAVAGRVLVGDEGARPQQRRVRVLRLGEAPP